MNNRKWSDYELDYLENRWGTVSPNSIAKYLNRTETAIIVKAKRLGLGGYKRSSELISVIDVAEILNVNRKTVYYLIERGQIKARKVKVRGKTRRYMLNIEDVFNFNETYQKQNNKKWTPYEISRLKLLYDLGLTNYEISCELNRSVRAVEHKIKLEIYGDSKRGE